MLSEVGGVGARAPFRFSKVRIRQRNGEKRFERITLE